VFVFFFGVPTPPPTLLPCFLRIAVVEVEEEDGGGAVEVEEEEEEEEEEEIGAVIGVGAMEIGVGAMEEVDAVVGAAMFDLFKKKKERENVVNVFWNS
jgi:hypothetical protein